MTGPQSGTARRGAGVLFPVLLTLMVMVAAAWPAAGDVAGAAPVTAGAAPLPYLHVVAPGPGSVSGPGGTANPYLADPSGRQVLLHGVDVVGLQDNFYAGGDGKPALYPDDSAAYDGKCPSDSSLEDEFPVCEVGAATGEWVSTAAGHENDVAQIRQQGFDVVRLALSWSLLEPTPGHYSATYLDRIAQFVAWSAQQGVYVILDMHQDQYSRYVLPPKGATLPAGCTKSTGNDGAPAWAVFTDAKPACALLGQSAINPAASAATYEFFHNHPVPGPKGSAPGTGLEDHYIGALAFLARRFEANPTVLGYEIMNEPPLGSLAALPLGNLYDASSQELYPFYKRVIEALTGVRDGLPTCPADQPTTPNGTCAYPQLAHVQRQSVFYEPLGLRNLFDFSAQVSAPFSSYPNLVYAPHIYTHVFTADASFLGVPVEQSPYPPTYTFGYATAQAEGAAMRSAVFVTEFGNAPSDDKTLLAGMTQAQQIALVGGSLWAWSGNTTDKSLGSCWAVYCRYSGPNQTPGHQPGSTEHLMASRVTYLDRVFPRATAGTLLSYADDPTTAAFAMVATGPSAVRVGDRVAETIVYLPARAHGRVVVSGAAVLDAVVARPDGSRLAYVAPTGRGRYTVRVGMPDPTVRATAAQRADSPLASIGEPQARAALQAGLAQIGTSSNPKIRGAAAEAPALLGSLLGTGPDPNGGS
jgi:endoglycosylceramidase